MLDLHLSSKQGEDFSPLLLAALFQTFGSSVSTCHTLTRQLFKLCVGSGLATNCLSRVQEQGSSLFVFNRTKAKADYLVDKGAKWAASPAEIAKHCTITFSCVFSDDALTEVFQQFLSGGPKKDSIFVDCSTVYPDTIRRLDAKCQEAGKRISGVVLARPSTCVLIQNTYHVHAAEYMLQCRFS